MTTHKPLPPVEPLSEDERERVDRLPYVRTLDVSWADIEIKIDPDAPPLPVTTVPGTAELEAALTVRLADLPDELRAELASGYAVLPPWPEYEALAREVNRELERVLLADGYVSKPPPVCIRLFDGSGALLERTGGCFCNTLDCPHRPAKGA